MKHPETLDSPSTCEIRQLSSDSTSGKAETHGIQRLEPLGSRTSTKRPFAHLFLLVGQP